LIGGNIDLYLLSLFPQKDERIMGGMEKGGHAFKVNNGGERTHFVPIPRRKKGYLYPPSKKVTVVVSGADYMGQVGVEYPPPGLSRKKTAPSSGSKPLEIRGGGGLSGPKWGG
jgi:hypothetical protein